MDVQKIRYNKELMYEKIRLQQQLDIVSKKMKEQQEDCNHVVVELNNYGYTPFTRFDVAYDCIICGKKDVYPIKRLVDAREYLRDKYINNTCEEEREEKLQILQQLAWKLIQEDEEISEEELAVKLQQLVDQNIDPRVRTQKDLVDANIKSCTLGQIELCKEVNHFQKYVHSEAVSSKSQKKIKGIIHRS